MSKFLSILFICQLRLLICSQYCSIFIRHENCTDAVMINISEGCKKLARHQIPITYSVSVLHQLKSEGKLKSELKSEGKSLQSCGVNRYGYIGCGYFLQMELHYIIQIYSGITRGRVLSGELYAQRLQKLIYPDELCFGIANGRVLNFGALYT